MTTAIALEGVGKRYWKFEEQAMLMRSLLPSARPRRSELWALRDVSFSVEQGETVGILGRNGSGKTTLLRLLAGVTRPSEGRVRVVGTVAPLISVGVGFRREMSGRENVYLNGMILGLTKTEIEARLDDIVSFAELGDFIDTPVKFYSSGMFLRLGFSVAVHTDPEVLLIDEVLAVGDVAFRAKCVERMRLIQESGTAIVLVSHSLDAVRGLCRRALLLRRGVLDFDGETEGAIDRYHEQLSAEPGESEETARTERRHVFVGGATILDRALVGPDGPAHYLDRDAPVEFRARVRFEQPTADPVFGFQILSEEGSVAYGCHTEVGLHHRSFAAGEEADVRIRFVPRLAGGSYRAMCSVVSANGRGLLADDHRGVVFFVDRRPGVYGAADLGGSLTVDGIELIATLDGDRPCA
ncbi:MAG TPA: ABC transporter ATP-binding protein [Acidimicrobiales bacterium]|nr:ABC transporter ATP-binding protein [Acidimicrobiales bacterium]